MEAASASQTKLNAPPDAYSYLIFCIGAVPAVKSRGAHVDDDVGDADGRWRRDVGTGSNNK